MNNENEPGGIRTPTARYRPMRSSRDIMPRKDLKTSCFQVPENPMDFQGHQPILRLSEAEFAVRYNTGP